MANFNIFDLQTSGRTLEAGEFGTIIASGALVSAGGIGVTFTGAASLVNDGLIQSNVGLRVNSDVEGANVVNSGRIIGSSVGVETSPSISGTTSLYLANSGTIAAAGLEAIGISVAGELVLNNTGVVASTDIGIIGRAGSTLFIRNSGTISGQDDAVQGGDGDDQLSSTGTIIGDVDMGAGNDTVEIVGGTVAGFVLGGAGDDTFIIGVAGVTILENFGDGRDTIYASVDYALDEGVETLFLRGAARNGSGNEASNSVIGNGYANTLSGEGGDDGLAGGAGRDTLSGDGGNDDLSGDLGHDVLFGGIGRDTMRGEDGDDQLTGGTGNDLLTGGLGADTLAGGLGNDRFIFVTVADSTASEGDTIRDLRRGSDKIDLAQIDARQNQAGEQAFTFVGAAGFTATGQVRIIDRGADVVVELNTAGDKTAEATFLLTGVGTLTASDFIL